MTALIWKEFRENLRWALLGMLAMTAACGFAVAEGLHYAIPYRLHGLTILNPTFQLVSLIGVPALAAGIGFLLVYPETRADRWGLLVHRPVGRTTIFAAKVITGVGLYLLAVVFPWVAFVAWTAAPGNVPAPFEWTMFFPGLVDLATGLTYFFAGMLTGLRQARWFGSRGLAGPAAFAATLIADNADSAFVALAVSLGMTAILAFAARSTFLADGEYRQQSLLGKCTLATSLLLGLFTIVWFATTVLSNLFAPEMTIHRYVVSRQGQVATLDLASSFKSLPSVTAVFGGPIRGLPDGDLSHAMITKWAAPSESARPRPASKSYRRSTSYFRTVGHLLWDTSGALWYYLPGKGEIQGFDARTNTRAGTIGPLGSERVSDTGRGEDRTIMGPLIQIEDISMNSPSLVFPDRVFYIDLAAQAYREVFRTTNGEKIRMATAPHYLFKSTDGTSLGFSADPRPLIIVTDRTMSVLDPTGTISFSAALSQSTQTCKEFTVWRAQEPERYFLSCQSYQNTVAPAENPKPWLAEYTPEGALVRHLELPAVPNQPDDSPIAWAVQGLLLPVAVLPARTLPRMTLGGMVDGWPRGDAAKRAMLAAMFASALACAVAAWFLARRYAFGRARELVWCALVFLTGPTGLALMICLLDWPARTPCLSCGKPRVVDRRSCEHCSHEFAAPPLDGTELFEQDHAA